MHFHRTGMRLNVPLFHRQESCDRGRNENIQKRRINTKKAKELISNTIRNSIPEKCVDKIDMTE
ncbi:hypothetical protein NECAME_14651 [Necator americanus]|uniref:Uncharacterized protein n=1 Tax=Necator americanus TaxID=51031 RepID=W2SP15_NECAM|nr:hypothetical protein NECAME_14651 [Necator americanus]ETN70616.1 hypothetical protein NECAME_14651 [Necator americanus]